MAENERILTANFTADTSGFAPKVNELIQKLKSLNQDFEQNKQKVNELNAKIKEYQKELSQLNSATNNGANATVQQAQRMQTLRDNIAACNTQIGTYKAAQTTLRSEINSTNRELTEQQKAFNGVNTAALSFGDILKANLASSVIQAGIRKVLDLLREAAAYCYEVGSSFEAGMSKVAAISGASADELERLTAKAKELGSSTKFTATETAEAMSYMAMAGWKTEEMLAGIDGVLGLAAASGTDLATTSDIVTDALTAFGLKASDCAHFADVLAAASSNANTNVSMMGETFKYCAPIAGALGFSAEDVAVQVGLMANSGIKATQAGTAMRTVMTKLAKDVKITGEAIGTVTVHTKNADGSMRELSDITADLRSVFSQLTKSEKSAAAQSIAGKNAMTGFLALMNAGEADVQKLTAAIENCDGAASAMADTMQDNLQGAMTKFNSALEGVGVAVYDKFKGGLTDAVNIFTEAMNDISDSVEGGALDYSLSNLADSFKDAAREIAMLVKTELPGFIDGLAKALDFVITFRKEIGSAVSGFIAFKAAMSIGDTINAAAKAFGSLKTAIDATESSQKGLNAAMAVNPFGIAAAAAGVLIAACTEIEQHLDDCNEKALDSLARIGDLIDISEDYKNKSEELDSVIRQFDDITESEADAATKNEKLTELQQTLISLCGAEASNIDLVTGAFENQAKTLENLNGLRDKYNEDSLSAAKGALEELKRLESYSSSFTVGGISDAEAGGIIEWAKKNLSTFETGKSSGATAGRAAISSMIPIYGLMSGNMGKQQLYLNGTYEDRLADLTKLREYLVFEKSMSSNSESVKNIDNMIAELKSQAEKKKSYEQQLTRASQQPDSGTSNANRSGFEAAKDKDKDHKSAEVPRIYDEDAYNEEKRLLDAKHSAGFLSEKEYYEQLKELRDSYLEEDTLAWYNATAAMNSAYKNMAGSVKSSLSEVQDAYKKTLAAIDAEIEKHNREKSDAAFQKKIDDIDNQLQYGRLDDFSKYELEKEKQRLIDDHSEELYKRSAADAKAAVANAYNAQQAYLKAQEGTREYTLAVGEYTDALGDLTKMMKDIGSALGVENGGTTNNTSIDESTKNNYVNVILQAVNRSNSQIVDELIKRLHSGL